MRVSQVSEGSALLFNCPVLPTFPLMLLVRSFLPVYCEFLPHFEAEYGLVLTKIWEAISHQ